MILVSSRIPHEATEFAPATIDRNGVPPGLPPVCGKPVHMASDGGKLTSDAGVLLLAEPDRKLGVSARLAECIEDPRDPAAVRHTIAEMIRVRALLIACSYHDASDLRCATARSGLQDGAGPVARDGRRAVLGTDDDAH